MQNRSNILFAYGIITDKQFVNTPDNILHFTRGTDMKCFDWQDSKIRNHLQVFFFKMSNKHNYQNHMGIPMIFMTNCKKLKQFNLEQNWSIYIYGVNVFSTFFQFSLIIQKHHLLIGIFPNDFNLTTRNLQQAVSPSEGNEQK